MVSIPPVLLRGRAKITGTNWVFAKHFNLLEMGALPSKRGVHFG